jgi:hypothetical protein
MAAPDNNARPVSSKSPRKLSAADLERICGVEPHPEKKCDYCGIPLAFPRTFTKDTFCYVCSALLNALMQTGNYWFEVQRQYETEILSDIIHKKILMGDGDEVSQ